MGTVKNLDVFLNRDHEEIEATVKTKDGIERSLEIDGEYLEHTNSFRIGTTDAEPKYFGSGIGFIVYKIVVMSGITLISGEQQTKGSETIWKKLIEDDEVFVYAIDDDISVEVDIHDGKVMAGDDYVYGHGYNPYLLVAKKKR